jgi:thiamine-monophosphate kinase
LPISESLQNAVGRSHAEQLALAGGDDYVLLFTAPAGARFDGCTPIGEINSGEGVTVLSNGQPRAMQQAGYAHF